MGNLPFCSNIFDAFFSTLSFHWINDPKSFLIDVLRILKPNGFLLINFLGGKTLNELRKVLIQAELNILNGSYQRISPFLEIKTIGDIFSSSGFEMNVIDTQIFNVTYSNLKKLIYDLRVMGETSNLIGRSTYLRKDVFKLASEIYKKDFSFSKTKIFASFEIITLTGWKPKN